MSRGGVDGFVCGEGIVRGRGVDAVVELKRLLGRKEVEGRWRR